MTTLGELVSSIPLDQVVFFILAAIAFVSAMLVVTVREVVHAALWLAVAFIGVAGLFILLNAEYLAIIQLLIYVGAVVVVILFGIMLTKREIMEARPP